MKSHKKYKFALVGHSQELAEAVKKGVDPEKEQIICKVVKVGEAIPAAMQLFDEGIEAIFGHMGNSRLMLEATGQPIVDIPRTRLDMIIAFRQARKFNRVIGLSSYAMPTEGIEIIEDLLDIHIQQLIFHTADELSDQVHKAYENGLRVLVGGGISTNLMDRLGGKGILSLPRKYVIDQAFAQARMIASINRKDLEQRERLNTILQMVDEGIIGTDQYGRLKTFNKAAEDILGLNKKNMLDQAFNRILKESRLIDILAHGVPERDTVCKINGVDVVVNAMPIIINQQSRGAIALFRGAKRIENINRKVKESLYSKGFVAKYRVSDICGKTKEITDTLEKASKYAVTDGNILIQGETGTGKEMLAQAVHRMSPRKNQPFVAINCAAIPDSLIESELFGHEEGAFTGAKRGGKIGLIELADKGTLFLDEIADISQELQVRLLRVIENKEVMRVGGDRYVSIDVRVISSSYKDLRKEIQTGNFRPDLYYRLATLKLNLPPLRHRLEDIPEILKRLITHHDRTNGAFTDEMVERLKRYHWPGNIRELASFVESYFILLGEKTIDPQIFSGLIKELSPSDINPISGHDPYAAPPECSGQQDKSSLFVPDRNDNLKKMVEKFEQTAIHKTLETCHFNKKETAKALGISVNTLWRKMRHNLDSS